MATKFSFSLSLIVVIFCSCFYHKCLSNKFTDENYLRLLLPEEGQRLQNILDHPSFPRLPVNAIYQFGDSLSDTGNLIRVDPFNDCAKWPYGESFSDKPTGRCSNGRLMIDFFAEFLKIPLLDAYLNKEGDFRHGVNFAVGGATALDASVLKLKYNISTPTNLSLSVQLDWLKSHFNSYYAEISDRRSKISKGLFMMGEIGGNDYNFALLQGKTLQVAYNMIPHVIQTLTNAIEEIIDLGATQIGIPGNFPIGCVPVYLSLFKTNDSDMYDELKCLKQYNKHSQFHNDQLQKKLVKLQKSHPNVSIVYMDYYGAFTQILRHATSFGFDESATQEACCGTSDDEHNVNLEAFCGSKGVPVCENPQEHISWDGLHLTQHAYHVLAKKLMPSLNNGVKITLVFGHLLSIIIIIICLILIWDL